MSLISQQLHECQLLRALARVLALPAVATTTAFTYLHRIRFGDHPCQLSGQELVTACIYLAAKVEEVNVSANQLINTARVLSHPSQWQLLHSLAPFTHTNSTNSGNSGKDAQQDRGSADGNLTPHHQSNATTAAAPAAAGVAQGAGRAAEAAAYTGQGSDQEPSVAAKAADPKAAYPQQQQMQQQQHCLGAAGPSAPPQQQRQQLPEDVVLVGDDYYAAKERLFTAEQVVLRLMSFQLGVQQPHKHLFNFCKLLSASRALAAAAVCLLNDAVAYTGVCLRCDAAVVAAAVLQQSWMLLSTSWQQQIEQQQHQEHSQHGRTHHGHHHRHESEADRGAAAKQQQQRGHRWSEEQCDSRTTSSSSSMAALHDGSWLGLVGLQQRDVEEVVQVLQQLLQLQSPQQAIGDGQQQQLS